MEAIRKGVGNHDFFPDVSEKSDETDLSIDVDEGVIGVPREMV